MLAAQRFMTKSITIQSVKGCISAPPSKSVAIRAIALASQKRQSTEIEGLWGCDDIDVALKMARDLGVGIKETGAVTTLQGGLKDSPTQLYAGESALAFRLFAPLVARLRAPITISASGSLLNRPLPALQQTLEELGVTCGSANGFAPFVIRGPITKNICHTDGGLSSQLISGLLISQAENPEGFAINVANPRSKPYIGLTLSLLEDFGIKVDCKGYESFYIAPGQSLACERYSVEGDYSGAAFFAVLAAAKGELLISNLRADSCQADRALLGLLTRVGAICTWQNDTVWIKRHLLKPFEFDARECPDLFPPLVALAACIDGVSAIRGSSRLVHKESNRAQALICEFGKLGIEMIEEADSLIVKGGTLRSGRINPHGDHRIAMAAAVCAGPTVKIEIDNPAVVDKSYRGFYHDLKKAGGSIE